MFLNIKILSNSKLNYLNISNVPEAIYKYAFKDPERNW